MIPVQEVQAKQTLIWEMPAEEVGGDEYFSRDIYLQICDPGENVDISFNEWKDKIHVSMCGVGKLNLNLFYGQVAAMNGDVVVTNDVSLQAWFGSLGGVKDTDGQYFLSVGGRELVFNKDVGSDNFWVQYVDSSGNYNSALLNMGQITDLVNGSIVGGGDITGPTDTVVADLGVGMVNRFANVQVQTGETADAAGAEVAEIEMMEEDGGMSLTGICGGLGGLLLAGWVLYVVGKGSSGGSSGFSGQGGMTADWQEAGERNYAQSSSTPAQDVAEAYDFSWGEYSDSSDGSGGLSGASALESGGGSSGSALGPTLAEMAVDMVNAMNAAAMGDYDVTAEGEWIK